MFTSIVSVLVPQARPDAIALRRLSYLVSSALGSCGALRLMHSVETHQVLPHQLRALHSRRRLLTKRNPVCPSTQSQRWLVGEVLELAASREPQLVIVVAVADAIDATAVASSVDQFSWFSMGGRLWAAGVCVARCPCASSVSLPHCSRSPCESLGSWLRRAWGPRRVAGQSPANMMWRLLLAQAHVQWVGCAPNCQPAPVPRGGPGAHSSYNPQSTIEGRTGHKDYTKLYVQ